MKYIFLFLIFICFESFSQKKTTNTEIETQYFLKQFLSNDSLIYYIKEIGIIEDNRLCKIYSDSIILKRDSIYINKLLSSKNKMKFKTPFQSNVKIIREKKFYKIDKDSILKNEKNRIMIISKPIFINNYKYCVFYYKVFFSGLGGSDELSLFEKINDIWVKKVEFCSSIN